MVLGIGLYPFGPGLGQRRFALGKHAILDRAREFASRQGIDTSGLKAAVQTIRVERSLEQNLYQQFGISRIRAASASGELPLPAWRVVFRRSMWFSNRNEDTGGIRITLSETGEVLSVTFHNAKENERAPARDEARTLAADWLAANNISVDGFVERRDDDDDDDDTEVAPPPGDQGYSIRVDGGAPQQPPQPPQPPGQSDSGKTGDDPPRKQRFVWERSDPDFPSVKRTTTITVGAAGVLDLSRTIKFETDFDSAILIDIVEGTLYGLFCTVIVIFLPGVLILRIISKDYVSIWRSLLVALLFTASIIAQWLIVNDNDDSIVFSVIGLAFLGGLLGFFLVSAWLAGEADAYFAWGKQNTEGTLSLLLARWNARQIWRETLEGYFWGWVFLAVLVVATAILALIFGPDVIKVRTNLYVIDANPVWLYWVGLVPWVIFYAVLCLLFLPAWGHRLMKRTWAAIAFAAIPASLFASYLGMADIAIGKLPPSLSWALLLGVGACLLVARRGFLTGALAVFFFSAFYYGVAGLFTPAGDVAIASALGLVLVSIPPGISVIAGAGFRNADVHEAPPPRLSRMMAQARRQEELNIAQRVQEGLLPAKDPVFAGFDIAGHCRPANEVGGDYFDYFKLPDGRLGIAVGDVSGKGVPAAFFMTLTKGFMEVASVESPTPQEALATANNHLRSHLARGTFVTMAYAILDPEERVVLCARAGHNPPVLASEGNPATFLSLPGLALGACPDQRFRALIKDGRVELSDGDTLVFYTDGVTEAMNAARAEFGEERLLDAVRRLYRHGSARDVLDGLLAEVDAFSAGANQHDDITIVVVKAAWRLG